MHIQKCSQINIFACLLTVPMCTNLYDCAHVRLFTNMYDCTWKYSSVCMTVNRGIHQYVCLYIKVLISLYDSTSRCLLICMTYINVYTRLPNFMTVDQLMCAEPFKRERIWLTLQRYSIRNKLRQNTMKDLQSAKYLKHTEIANRDTWNSAQ